MMTLLDGPAELQAQNSEGSVRLTPAMSNVATSDGRFTVYVVLEDFQHFGAITYDDDRDGTPDRQVESNGMAAFQFTVEYDADVVDVTGGGRGPNLNSSGRSFQCLPPIREPGEYTYGCLSQGSGDGVQGSLTLAELHLEPRSRGFSALALSAQISGPLGDNVLIDASGAAVRVTGSTQPEPESPTVPPGGENDTPTPDAGEPADPTSPPDDNGTPTTVEATSTARTQLTMTRVASMRTPGPDATETPDGVTVTEPGDGGDSGIDWSWLWAASAVVATGLTALGFAAVLLRRRAQDGLL
jgi:hypothetical protein